MTNAEYEYTKLSESIKRDVLCHFCYCFDEEYSDYDQPLIYEIKEFRSQSKNDLT